ncbi:MAG: TVP38/TMEM64 family protein [Planctomycetota bacterium]
MSPPSLDVGSETTTPERANGGSTAKVLLLVVAATGLAAAFRFLPVADGLAAFLEWVRGFGVLGPVLLGAVYVLATVLMAPGLLLTLGAGYLFGVVVGTITVSIASVAGATAAFLVGRYTARDFATGLADRYPRFGAIDAAVAQSGWRIVLLTRLSPLFPFNVINYLYGATRVSLRDYVLASWVGMLPGTVLYVYLGHAAGDLTDLLAGKVEAGAGQQAAFWIGLAATAAVTVLVTRLAGKALRDQTPLSAAGPAEDATADEDSATARPE